MIIDRNPKGRGQSPSSTLLTTNNTRTALGSNGGLRGQKLATNRL